MKRAPRRVTCVLEFVLMFGVAACIAQPVAASDPLLTWNAPPECPSASELKEHVMELMGGAVQSNLTAATSVTRHADRYRAHVVVRGRTGFGESELEAARCEQLLDSVALLIALSIPSQEGSASQAEARSAAYTVPVSVQGRILFGAVPEAAAGLGGAIALEALLAVRLEVHGAYYAPQSTAFAGTRLGARFALLAAGVRACRLWSVGSLALGPCSGAEVHHVTATAFGGMPSRAGSAVWWGPALGLLSRLSVSKSIAIYVAAEAVVPLSRPWFRFSDAGDLHRVSAVALQVVLAPEVRF